MKISNILIISIISVILIFTSVVNVGAQDDVTLNVIMGVWAEDILNEYFDDFEEETGIKVEYEALPFRSLFETIQIRQEANDTNVDVIFVDAPLTASYAERGYIKPLDPYFTDEEIENTWFEATAEIGYWNDSFWSAPLNNSSQILYYNKDLLSENDIDFPSTNVEDRWTWEQLVEAARKIRDSDEGIYGFSFDQINRYYQLQVLPESLGGGSGINENNLADITNEGWIEAFDFYHKLYEDWNISPRGVSVDETQEIFAAGNIGFFVSGLWDIVTFNDSDVNFGVAPHPYFEDGNPVTPTHSWHLGIWSHTEHEEEAAELIKYLTVEPDVSRFWFENHGQFPANKKVIDDIYEDDKYDEMPFIGYQIAAYEIENTAVARAKTPAFLEFEEMLSNAFEDIRNGIDPKMTLEQYEQQINRTLQRYNR